MFHRSGSLEARWPLVWTLAFTRFLVEDFFIARAAIFDFLGAQVTLACLAVPLLVFIAWRVWTFALTLACLVIPLAVTIAGVGCHFAFTLACSVVPILFHWITTAPVLFTLTTASVVVIDLDCFVAICLPRYAVTAAISVIVDCQGFLEGFASNYFKNVNFNLFLARHRAVFNQLLKTASHASVQNYS